MKGRELDGGNDDKEPKRRASIGVFLYTNKHFIVSTGYNLHYTRKKEFDGGIDDKETVGLEEAIFYSLLVGGPSPLPAQTQACSTF